MQLQDLKALLERVSAEEDVEKPYEHLYQRADELKRLIEELQKQQEPEGGGQALQLQLASLQAERGVVLLETDLLEEGEQCVAAGLPCLQKTADQILSAAGPQQPLQDALQTSDPSMPAAEPPQQPTPTSKHVQILQACYNGQGALWSRRGDMPKAIDWLGKAEQLWERVSGLAKASPSDALLQQTVAELESGYTSTLFYQAQVYAHAGNKDMSANYCGATLERQLAQGTFDRSEWVQNCLQLAGYYLSCNAFQVASNLIRAAELVAQGHPRTSQGAIDDGKPTTTTTTVDDDVAANLGLARAKLCRHRLSCSHQRHILNEDVALPGIDGVPAVTAPTFTALGDQLSTGGNAGSTASLVQSFDEARELYNQGMEHYNAGLAFYKLDGWVTEHVNLLLEIAQMLRMLADFEADGSRRAAMHKLRAARLQPVCGGALNPEFYLPLAGAAELESANAWRDFLEAKLSTSGVKQSDGKTMQSAAQSAAKHYRAFLSTFPVDLGSRIPDEYEGMYIKSSFSLGRILNRCTAGTAEGQISLMMEAHERLQCACKYVEQHGLTEYKTEAALAAELASLLAEKVDLHRRVNARK